MAKIIEARVIQKIDTEQNWNANELILYKGEIALVGDPDRVYNIKVGNGVKKFRDLPYMVDYINGLYTGVITPQSQVPSGINNVFLVSEQGTYTNFGGVVLPKDNLGIIYKNSDNYTIQLIPIVSEEKLQEYIDEKLVNINLGFGGEIIDLNQSPTIDGMYIPKVSGIYPNFGNLEYNLTEGFTVFLYKDSQFSKITIPLSSVENTIDYKNSILGVSGKAVELHSVKKISTIEDLRNTKGEYEGQVIELLGITNDGDFNAIKYTWTDAQQSDNGGTIINVGNGSWLAVEDSIPFLVKETVSDLINMSQSNIDALKKGLYKGVTLLGYYTKGDTPAHIIYYLSDTTKEDDGGSVFEVGGIKLEHNFVGDINIRYFGAKGDTTQNIYFNVLNCLNYALDGGNNIYFPQGIYNTFNRNFPFRKLESDTYEGLKDLKDIVIYGDGKSTVFKTESLIGADVLQLNSIKNFTVRNLSVTATLLAFNNAGSNGVSITNGFDNIEIIDVHCFDLGSVSYPDPSQIYIDGGKAFTFQSSRGNTNFHGRAVIKGTAKNCAYGYEHSGFMSDIYNDINNYNITLDITTENSYMGCSISLTEPTELLNDTKSLQYNANLKIINSQQDVVIHRLFGANIDITVKSTKSINDIKINPLTGNEWLSSTISRLMYVGAIKRGKLSITGFKEATEDYGSIGSIGSLSETNYDGGTQSCYIYLDVEGNFNNSLTVATNAQDRDVHNCNLILNNITTLPTKLFVISKNNNIIVNGVPFVSEISTNKVQFKLKDPTIANNRIIEYTPDGALNFKGGGVGSYDGIPLLNIFGSGSLSEQVFLSLLNGGGLRLFNTVGTGIKISIGITPPEGNVVGVSGDIYIRTGESGGSRIPASIWFKQSISGNTGWVRLD